MLYFIHTKRFTRSVYHYDGYIDKCQVPNINSNCEQSQTCSLKCILFYLYKILYHFE